MPPKRKNALEAADPNVQPPNEPKKVKTGGTMSSLSEEDAIKAITLFVRNNGRWSAVSGSANIDISYRVAVRNEEVAYRWMCTCPPPWAVGDDDDDDDEEDGWESTEDEESNSDDGEVVEKDAEPAKEKRKCDSGKTCHCGKYAEDYPEHEWIFSAAAIKKFNSLCSLAALRDPDNFSMYTFNDHYGYGVLEVVQNLIQDYKETRSNGARSKDCWRKQWVIIEALALFLLSGDGLAMSYVDDGDMVAATVELVFQMVLTTLATLEQQGLLRADSEVKNLGLVIAMYLKATAQFRDASVLEMLFPEDISGNSKRFRWDPTRVDEYLYKYATDANIPLKGLYDMDKYIPDTDEDVVMPAKKGKDPWKFAAALDDYPTAWGIPTYAFRGWKRQLMGGDGLDITSWTREERKKASFNGKDPLGDEEIKKLQEGMVLEIV